MAARRRLEWTFGDRLRKAREAAGMEQAEIAAAFGVSPAAVSKWERSLAQPRNLFTVAQRWAEITEVPVEYLLGVEGGSTLSSAIPGWVNVPVAMALPAA